MTFSFIIPVAKIIEKAFVIRDKNPELSINDMIKEILDSIHITIEPTFEPIVDTSIRKEELKEELKELDIGKNKKEVSSEKRCMARTIFESIHMENGLLKKMREDPKNLYGDRCKNHKNKSSNFCTRHSYWQTLGVWNGEYRNKFEKYVKKKENPSKKSDVKEKRAGKKKKSEIVCQIVDKQKEKTNDSDEDLIDAEFIIIDGKNYYIDQSNNVWTNEGNLVGVYDQIKKQWL